MAKLKLTDKLGKQIIEAIKSGNTMEDAAAVNNISVRTLHLWLNEGEKAAQRIIQGESEDRKLLRRFYEEVQRAKISPKVQVVSKLFGNAMNGDQRAIEFILSRKYPDEWGAQKTVNIGNANGQPFQTTQISLEDWKKQQEEQKAAQEKQKLDLENTLALFDEAD